MERIDIKINEVGVLQRLDLFLTVLLTDSDSETSMKYRGEKSELIESLKLENLTRSQIAKVLKQSIKVNDTYSKPGYKLREGDVIEINFAAFINELEKIRDKNDGEIKSQEMELDVVDESPDYIVINKPKGIVVHPGAGNLEGTLANFIKGYLEGKGEYDPELERAGIVHRLDKGVSGLMIVAKNRAFQLNIKKQFESHEVGKYYLAQVEDIKPSLTRLRMGDWINVVGFISRRISDRRLMEFTEIATGRADERNAVSRVKYLSGNEVLINIITGRKHQIRATLKSLGLKIVGDTTYGAKPISSTNGIMLECVGLVFHDMKGERKEYFIDNRVTELL